MWLLSIPSLESTAGKLNTGIPQTPPYGITVRLEQNALRITHKNVEVFPMKVRVIGNELDVDYPRTTDDHGGAGWAHLGMVLARLVGNAQGCAMVTVSTLSESSPAAMKYWARYNLSPGTMAGRPLSTALQAAVALNSSKDQMGVPYLDLKLS
jgi:hypothetical protein